MTGELAERQAFALAKPFNSAAQDIALYRRLDEQRDGNLLLSVLAVDR